jgi:hypothetical protein
LEHLVGDRSRNLVNECLTHLGIVSQGLYGPLVHLCFLACGLLAFLLPQLLAGRLLVLLHDLIGDHVQERVLRASDTHEQRHG